MMKQSHKFIFLILANLHIIQMVVAHARLMEPPSRSSMWRFGFNTPKNYDDDGLYCGGMEVQHKKNGGKCGVCGDPWHIKPPRPNETGGKYGQGIIARSYKTGQGNVTRFRPHPLRMPVRCTNFQVYKQGNVIQAVVDITANHRGYFEFKVCPGKNDQKEVIQECLDKHTLKIVNSSNTRYFVEEHGNSRVTLALQLPKSLTCKRCVFQWTYIAGNNWGNCKNGTYSRGCGSQETFKACSDISIGNFQHSTLRPSVTTNRYQRPPNDKKRFPVKIPSRPKLTKITFEEAIEKIKKDPKLSWMLRPKKQNS